MSPSKPTPIEALVCHTIAFNLKLNKDLGLIKNADEISIVKGATVWDMFSTLGIQELAYRDEAERASVLEFVRLNGYDNEADEEDEELVERFIGENMDLLFWG